MKSSVIEVQTARGAWLEAVLACFQRLAVLVLFNRVLGLSLSEIAMRRDGKAYLPLAQACITGLFSTVGIEDRQYFVGYPVLLGLFGRIMPLETAFIPAQVLCVGGAALLAFHLFRSAWTARWFIFCIPAYVLFSSLNMSEGLTLLLVLGTVLTFSQNRFVLSSVLLGASFWVRPQSVFLLGAVLALEILFSDRRKNLFWIVSIPSLLIAGLFWFNWKVSGDPLINYRLYSIPENNFISIPIVSALHRLLDPRLSWPHKIYITACVLFTLSGLVLLFLRFLRKQTTAVEGIFLKWGIVQFLFFLSLGSLWGVRELPRYLAVIFPAVLSGWEPYLPKNRAWIWAGAVLAVIFCVTVEMSGNN